MPVENQTLAINVHNEELAEPGMPLALLWPILIHLSGGVGLPSFLSECIDLFFLHSAQLLLMASWIFLLLVSQVGTSENGSSGTG